MQDKYKDQWERLGSKDPYWGVLTDPDKKNGGWQKEAFFRTGEMEVEAVLDTIRALGIPFSFGTALDFGCGVGRLSGPLASHFSKVVGSDISSAMLKEARRACREHANIEFVQNSMEGLGVIADNSMDFIYSNIVLQHMPRHRQADFLREFSRVLQPGGLLAVQIPSRCNLKTWQGWLFKCVSNSILNQVRKVRYGRDRVMEVHALPRTSVLEILKEERMEIVRIEENHSTGPAFIGYMYFARKA